MRPFPATDIQNRRRLRLVDMGIYGIQQWEKETGVRQIFPARQHFLAVFVLAALHQKMQGPLFGNIKVMSIRANNTMPIHLFKVRFADWTLEKGPMLFQIETARFNFFHDILPFLGPRVHTASGAYCLKTPLTVYHINLLESAFASGA